MPSVALRFVSTTVMVAPSVPSAATPMTSGSPAAAGCCETARRVAPARALKAGITAPSGVGCAVNCSTSIAPSLMGSKLFVKETPYAAASFMIMERNEAP